MGNEKSQPTGLVIEENAIEVADRWSLHSAIYSGASGNPKISVFVSPTSSSQSNQNLLEKFAKNLMIHRHPCILKYVTTWQKGGKLYLATEGIKPLVQVLPTQTALQVCIGLQNVLKALVFLHDKAQSSHNNVCRAAVYVTQDGSWKLGGLEYLCRFSELSSGYLSTSKVGRYDAAISPNEQDKMPQPPSSVDCYAFGVLAEEVLSTFSPDDVPGMQDFRDICKHQLQNGLQASRPALNSLLDITFFTHEFISIHNFLTELTLKNDIEKQEFFRGLSHKLSMFGEEVVASQLSSLLLSRMVLLDTTAQQDLLPLVFVPRTNSDDVGSGRLFSEKSFRTHLVPKLLPMFCVRDAHVRLILLTHFSSFCSMFTATHLKTHILPELLVGIKDTNDTLVSCTLRALADIVPILGSSVVIGGKSRMKLFADGRPKAASARSSSKNHGSRSNVRLSKHGENEQGANELCLPERASPDGGEDFNSPIYTASEEETENWTDWENTGEDSFHIDRHNESTTTEAINEKEVLKSEENIIDDKTERNVVASKLSSSNVNDKETIANASDTQAKTNNVFHTDHKNSLPDITTLDIKISKTNVTNKRSNESSKSSPSSKSNKSCLSSNDSSNAFKEIDYFQDMEPVIITSNKHNISDLSVSKGVSKFDVNVQDLVMNDVVGWGDDEDDVDVTWTGDSDIDVNNAISDNSNIKNHT